MKNNKMKSILVGTISLLLFVGKSEAKQQIPQQMVDSKTVINVMYSHPHLYKIDAFILQSEPNIVDKDEVIPTWCEILRTRFIVIPKHKIMYGLRYRQS